MKNLKYICSGILGTALLMGGVGCKKDFLDINVNPNKPSDVEINFVLPSAELAIAHTIGNNFQVFGGIWGQYWTQSPASSQYKTVEQYSPGAADFDRPWRILYADALTDLRYIQKRGTEEGLMQYVAIAKILEGYSFQLLTDNFGDIPYSQALSSEAGILSPSYDSQQNVYTAIIQTVKDGLALADENDPFHPNADDVIYGGDMHLWTKFGNTLLLKMYLRLSEVDPGTAQAGIAQLESDGAEFLDLGESALIHYTTSGGNTHPYYAVLVEIGGTQNLVASSTCVDSLIARGDPRLDVFYAPAPNGSQVGILQGNYLLPASTQVSKPGVYTGCYFLDPASQTADVRFLSDYESMFLQSEASARGWLSSDAQALYEGAITASFEATGFTTGEDTTYLANPGVAFPASGSLANKLDRIITEKWFAMCGTQGDEAWIEWRRTNLPTFFVPSFTSIAGPGVWPYRLFYPSSEVTRNTNFPGQKDIDDKVWWDVN